MQRVWSSSRTASPASRALIVAALTLAIAVLLVAAVAAMATALVATAEEEERLAVQSGRFHCLPAGGACGSGGGIGGIEKGLKSVDSTRLQPHNRPIYRVNR